MFLSDVPVYLLLSAMCTPSTVFGCLWCRIQQRFRTETFSSESDISIGMSRELWNRRRLAETTELNYYRWVLGCDSCEKLNTRCWACDPSEFETVWNVLRDFRSALPKFLSLSFVKCAQSPCPATNRSSAAVKVLTERSETASEWEQLFGIWDTEWDDIVRLANFRDVFVSFRALMRLSLLIANVSKAISFYVLLQNIIRDIVSSFRTISCQVRSADTICRFCFLCLPKMTLLRIFICVVFGIFPMSIRPTD